MAKKVKKIQKAASIRGFEPEHVPHSEWMGQNKENFTSTRNTNIDTLYNTVRHSPEVVACFSAIVEDIMADGWKFFSSTKKHIKGAKAFEIQSKYKSKLVSALWDLLITGNAYILKLGIDADNLKSIIVTLNKNLRKEMGIEISDEEIYELVDQEDIEIPKDLQVLKSSTVDINYDDTGEIQNFKQNVNGKKRVFRPRDIIHLTTIKLGGQPYGFTSLEPLLSDIGTLIFAKEFAGKYFENDGTPNLMINLPNATPNDRQYSLLKKEIKELRKSANKYRTLVTTGPVVIDKISKFDRDLEFYNLIKHFTQIILMTLGVPAHRVNWTVDVKNSGGEVGKIEAGYYKKIQFMQLMFESELNADLWSIFKTEMKFNKSYKIDEIREAEVIRILSEIGAITLEEAREKIGMEATIPEGTTPTSIGSDKGIDMTADKKREAGTDKPKESKVDNKVKQINKDIGDCLIVDFPKFKLFVENTVGIDKFTDAKVLYIETTKDFILLFDDGQWKYKTVIPKSTIDVEQFKVETLRNAMEVGI